MFALSAAVVALPLFFQAAAATECNRWYTVQDGDICDSISAANNASTYQLATINYGYIDEECSNLQPGSSICLGYGNEDCSTTYVVVADDTCERIAEKTAVNTTLIHANNPQINDDCGNIYIGEVLCVADSVIIPPAPQGYVPETAIPTTAVAAVSTTAEAVTIATEAPAPTTTAEAEPAIETLYDSDDESIPYCDEL